MEKQKNSKGITLIALVITIIVLLILAMVSIRLVLNGGIIAHAENATSKYKTEEEKERIQLAYSEYQMAKYTNPSATLGVEGATVTGDATTGWNVSFTDTDNEYSLSTEGIVEEKVPEAPITNPYKGVKEWAYAYTCTDGKWENTPLTTGQTIPDNADIVAYFYKTGKSVTPTLPVESETVLGLPAGDEYHMVIEGTGEMPLLVEGETGYAWMYECWANEGLTGPIFYTTEVIICSGITNLGEGAFMQAICLNNITMPNSITSIEEGALSCCYNLKEVTLPSELKFIGDGAFENCYTLTNITIPSKVSKISHAAFLYCINMKKVKILSINLEVERKGYDYDNAFQGFADESIIYVLNDTVKNELEGMYDSPETTVKVVTQAEINNL